MIKEAFGQGSQLGDRGAIATPDKGISKAVEVISGALTRQAQS
jgi:hypothetical protein